MRYLLMLSVFLAVPLVVSAQTLVDVLSDVLEVLKAATTVIAAALVLFYLFGLAMFMLGAADEEKRKKGKALMIWGLIIIFIFFSLWGIISIMQASFLGDASSGTPSSGILI